MPLVLVHTASFDPRKVILESAAVDKHICRVRLSNFRTNEVVGTCAVQAMDL